MGTEWQDEVPYPGPSYEPGIFDFIADIGKVYGRVLSGYFEGIRAVYAVFDEFGLVPEPEKTANPHPVGPRVKCLPPLKLEPQLPPRHVGPRPRRQYDKNGRRRY